MGKHRFRLSDMIPNAWFYKLKDMGRTRNQNIINHPKKKKKPPTSSSASSSSSLSTSSTTTAIPPQQSKSKQPHLVSDQRKSYYFTRELTPPPQSPTQDTTLLYTTNPKPPDSPRKSSKQRRRRNRASNRQAPKLITASVSAGCSCRATIESVWTKPDSTSEDYPNSPLDSSSDLESLFPEFGSDHDPALPTDSFDGRVSWSGSCHCTAENDIVFDMNDKSLNPKFDGFNAIAKLELPPIITKKNDCNDQTKFTRTSAEFEERNADGSLSVKIVKADSISTSREQRTSPVRRLSASSPGVRLRTNSPRIASRKIQAHARKSVSSGSSLSSRSRRSLSESFAVVKSSADPHRDFKESMVEMILENNIRASKDLEDLLACYLQLNSDEYHELIIKVFKQIWFDLADVRLK